MIVAYTQEAVAKWQPGMEVDLAREMQAIVLRIILKLLINIDVLKEGSNIVEIEEKHIVEIVEGVTGHTMGTIEGLLNLLPNLPFVPPTKRKTAIRQCDAYLYALIERRLADTRDVGDMLSILLSAEDEHGNRMAKKQVRDALVSLIAAGHETSTNTLAWTMYLLSAHPMAFEKVQAELRTVLGGRNPELSDLPQLTYLDQVIKESMRLYPAGWTQGRCAVEDFELDGYHFPAGTFFMFSQWTVHRNPDFWEDADTFRPERWAPTLERKGPKWAYFPFGGGSRMCLGKSLAELEVFLMLATILQHYYPRVLPGHKVEPLPFITLLPKNGLPVRLEPTQDSVTSACCYQH